MAEAYKSLPKRSEIPAELKWKLEDVFATDDLWNESFAECEKDLEIATSFRGTLGESAEKLLAYFEYHDRVSMLLDRLFIYAAMRQDEDNANPTYQAMKNRIESLCVRISAALAFVDPEILAIPAETLAEWFKRDDMQIYRRHIEEITRMAPHIRNAEEEQLLALAGDMTSAPRNIYNMFNNADIKFAVIEDEDGQQVEITHGNYILLMESRNREVRQNAFKGMYSAYSAHKNSLAAMMTANIKKDIFGTRVRNFSSVLECALFGEEIPVSVYDNLIAAVRKNLPDFYRYLELRKKALGLDELHLYDVYVPLYHEKQDVIPYNEAVETVLASLEPMGEEYCRIARTAFTEGWVDVMENQGKTSGAYSTGAYGVHPYILLNHQDNLNSMFTIAHELGHAMHTYYSNCNQPYICSDYCIFVAEVASTVNETLLLRHLLDKETDKDRRLLLVNYYLDQFRGTVFRQTMFAEFEKLTHERAFAGEPLSCEYYQELYYQLNQDYFGPGMVCDREIDMEWARIPHFYRAFYVYKYATGFTAATALAEGLLSGDEDARKRYLEFLSGGSSKSPIELLRGAGVDMEDPASLDRGFNVYRKFLNELEELVG